MYRDEWQAAYLSNRVSYAEFQAAQAANFAQPVTSTAMGYRQTMGAGDAFSSYVAANPQFMGGSPTMRQNIASQYAPSAYFGYLTSPTLGEGTSFSDWLTSSNPSGYATIPSPTAMLQRLGSLQGEGQDIARNPRGSALYQYFGGGAPTDPQNQRGLEAYSEARQRGLIPELRSTLASSLQDKFNAWRQYSPGRSFLDYMKQNGWI